MLSILSGHKRYAHVTGIRGDGVNPGWLNRNKVLSEDALRKALKRIPETAGTTWLDAHLLGRLSPLLDAPWILDTDTTIKRLYGHQEGAVVSYHPRKPGRPSHSSPPICWPARAGCWGSKFFPAMSTRPSPPAGTAADSR